MVRRQLPGQPSLFGVAATDPSPEDLAGLLAGPATLRRMGGTAQVSVLVDAAWRVHVLVAELSRRALSSGWEPSAEGYLVRTAFTTQLVPLANAWSAGLPDGLEGANSRKCPPSGLHLGGQALRLWVAAAGVSSPDGYLLRLGAADVDCWPAVGAALSAAGLAAALVMPSVPGVPSGSGGSGGPGVPAPGASPAYRITGRRRLARLAELVGDPPPTAPAPAWPTAPTSPIKDEST